MQQDNITHHPSNRQNCPQCMDLWIAQENERAEMLKNHTCGVLIKSHNGYKCPECYKITK